MRLAPPERSAWPAYLIVLVCGLVAIGLGWAARDRDETRQRLATAELQIEALRDAGMTWAAVAEEAHSLAELNEARCAWSLVPRKDRAEILDTVLIGCSRRDPCLISWAPGDEP